MPRINMISNIVKLRTASTVFLGLKLNWLLYRISKFSKKFLCLLLSIISNIFDSDVSTENFAYFGNIAIRIIGIQLLL